MSGAFYRNVIVKALILFLVANLLLALIPFDYVGHASLYNILIPGRERFPFGEDPQQSYNFSTYVFEAMIASHKLHNGAKPADEYRVILVGDSSVWGTLLHNNETLAGQLNALNLQCNGKALRAYNLGYPTISLTKDLMILDELDDAQADRIVWLTTLEAWPRDRQLDSPLVAHNADRVRELIQRFDLKLDSNDPAFVNETFWDHTIIGQRRALADIFRLQLYGVMWAATGIDQVYPANYEPAARDLATDTTFNGWSGPNLPVDQLATDVLEAGFKAVHKVPMLLVNEPILISQGQNSEFRYNFYYPRWAYDQYRQILSQEATSKGWEYLDAWNLVDQKEFTNSAIHLTPASEGVLAQAVAGQVCR